VLPGPVSTWQRGGALRPVPGQRASEHGLGDTADRHPQVERRLHGPAAGALLLRLVQDDIDERLATGVLVPQHIRSDLHEVGLEVAGVPLVEDVGDLGRGQPGSLAQQLVGLGDELHVGVLDAVVHHLHEVSGAVRADVRAARRAVDHRRDALQHRADEGVRLLRAPRHDAGAVKRALLAAADPGADVQQPAVGEGRGPPDCVDVAGIAAVDDHVTLLQQLGELLDHGVGPGAGLHHHDHPARPGQRLDKIRQAVGADELALVAVVVQELVSATGVPVVHDDLMAVTRQVAGQVGTHDSQAGDADLLTHETTLPRTSSGSRSGATSPRGALTPTPAPTPTPHPRIPLPTAPHPHPAHPLTPLTPLTPASRSAPLRPLPAPSAR